MMINLPYSFQNPEDFNLAMNHIAVCGNISKEGVVDHSDFDNPLFSFYLIVPSHATWNNGKSLDQANYIRVVVVGDSAREAHDVFCSLIGSDAFYDDSVISKTFSGAAIVEGQLANVTVGYEDELAIFPKAVLYL
ncbi:MAG: hypothetical protein ACOYIK_09205 [Coriobacteriales bacterium]|jgi:hypothetical protein